MKKTILMFPFLMLAIALMISSTSAMAFESKWTKFVDDCLDRVTAHDETVYDDCYTDDFILTGGPETYHAPNRMMIGRAAVRSKMVMGKGDTDAWDSFTMETEDIAGSENTLVRLMHQRFTGPTTGSYIGFEGLPRDMTFPIEVITVYTFRDGKIAQEFFQYDSLGFMLDLSQGDPDKVAKSLRAMATMIEYQKEHGAMPENLSEPKE